MGNLKKSYNRLYSFCAYNLFLYASFLLLLVFLLKLNQDLIISISVKLLPAYIVVGVGGYLLNDLFDQKSDQLSNKFNFSIIVNKYILSFLIIVLWVLGFCLIDSISRKASFFLCIQFLALLLYSMPFPRFKEKGLLGLITDAFYAHVIPEIILLIILQQYISIPYVLSISFLTFTFSLGMRDILKHQLDDIRKDATSRTETYALSHAENARSYLIYFENIAVGSLLSFLTLNLYLNYSDNSLVMLLVLATSYIVVIVKHQALIKDALINNYIVVSSIFIGYSLIINKSYEAIILLIHPYFISYIFTNMKRVISFCFKTIIPLMINYSLYYVFLLFGRNLKKRPLKNSFFSWKRKID